MGCLLSLIIAQCRFGQLSIQTYHRTVPLWSVVLSDLFDELSIQSYLTSCPFSLIIAQCRFGQLSVQSCHRTQCRFGQLSIQSCHRTQCRFGDLYVQSFSVSCPFSHSAALVSCTFSLVIVHSADLVSCTFSLVIVQCLLIRSEPWLAAATLVPRQQTTFVKPRSERLHPLFSTPVTFYPKSEKERVESPMVQAVNGWSDEARE